MIGLILLNTRFPRPIGDAGNPASWNEHVRIARLSHANVGNVVVNAPLTAALVDELVAAGNTLAADGARCITTSCGFFASIQSEIAPRLAVPFIASSLCLIPHVLSHEGLALEHVGVLTFDAETLGARHFAGIPSPKPAAQKGLFSSNIVRKCVLFDALELDLKRAEADMVDCARAFKEEFPRVTTLILECTNLAPYRAAMQAATGLRMLDIRDAVERLCPISR